MKKRNKQRVIKPTTIRTSFTDAFIILESDLSFMVA